MEELFGTDVPTYWVQYTVGSPGSKATPLGTETSPTRFMLCPVPTHVLTVPKQLAVLVRLKTNNLEGGVEFATEDPSLGPGSATKGAAAMYSRTSAMPVRVYRVPASSTRADGYVLQVPGGMFDKTESGDTTYTFLSHDMRYTASSYASAPSKAMWPYSALG
jgi:hypothetical protein